MNRYIWRYLGGLIFEANEIPEAINSCVECGDINNNNNNNNDDDDDNDNDNLKQ